MQGAFPVKLLKYSADEINIYRKQKLQDAKCVFKKKKNKKVVVVES